MIYLILVSALLTLFVSYGSYAYKRHYKIFDICPVEQNNKFYLCAINKKGDIIYWADSWMCYDHYPFITNFKKQRNNSIWWKDIKDVEQLSELVKDRYFKNGFSYDLSEQLIIHSDKLEKLNASKTIEDHSEFNEWLDLKAKGEKDPVLIIEKEIIQ